MTKKERITITIDGAVLSGIDKGRGLIPRATYINEKMKEIVMPASVPQQTDTTASKPD
jgi:hypothetical protein